MKKLLFILGISFIIVFSLTACNSAKSQNQISKELGIDVSSGKELSNYDTHSGNGDGTTCIVLSFENDDVLKQIEENSDWNKFPLDEITRTLVYGVDNQTSSIGPFLNNDKGENLVPQIENGYYILIDRQSNQADNILDRGSFNFTLGIYNTDNNNLYFCKLDT